MADGRICDGIGFAQIKPICAAPACRTEGTIPVPNGGSAYGYQPGFALSALQETADVRVTDPYIYAQAFAGRLSASAALRLLWRSTKEGARIGLLPALGGHAETDGNRAGRPHFGSDPLVGVRC